MAALNNYAPTFSINGGYIAHGAITYYAYEENFKAVMIQADGKIIAAGTAANLATPYSGGGLFTFYRYNTDGTIDTTFGTNGAVQTNVDQTSTADYLLDAVAQTDGKFITVGYSGSTGQIVCYNADGSLDSNFDLDGSLSVSSFTPKAAFVQDDGKIVVAGMTAGNIIIARYNSDGSVDTDFGTNGQVNMGAGSVEDITVQADDQFLVTGNNNNDFLLVRVDADGVADSTFGSSGRVITDFPSNIASFGQEVLTLADGKIIVIGRAYSNGDIVAIAHYSSDGTLDTDYGGDGMFTTSEIGPGGIGRGLSAALQEDGKLIIGGTTGVMRLNADGSLDTTFGTQGIASFAISGGFAHTGGFSLDSITIQEDGQIVLAGSASVSSGYGNLLVVRLTASGQLDPLFGGTTTLGGEASVTEDGSAVVLDTSVQIIDLELASAGNYGGASVTLSCDVDSFFATSGNLRFGASGGQSGAFVEGSDLYLSDIRIGTVTTVVTGGLILTFNTNATQTLVNQALSSIAFGVLEDAPPSTTDIIWRFSDGNTGAQGDGSSGTVTGKTTITISGQNDAPIIVTPPADTSVEYIGGSDAATIFSGLRFSDVELDASGNYNGAQLTYRITQDPDAYDEIGYFGIDGNASKLSYMQDIFVEGITIGKVTSNGTITFNSSATAALIASLIDTITYSAASVQSNYDETAVLSFADKNTFLYGGSSVSQSVSIALLASNDAPEFTGSVIPLNCPVGGTPITFAPNLSVHDVELGNLGYTGSSLIVSRAGGANGGDRFYLGDGGPLAQGSTINSWGEQIGTVTHHSGGNLKLTFNQFADANSISALMQQLAYSNSGGTPNSTINLAITFNDGNKGAQGVGGTKSTTELVQINLKPPVNAAPRFTNTDDWGDYFDDIGPNYILNGTAVRLSNAVQIVDYNLAATGNYSGASLTLRRADGASAQDNFYGSGDLGALTQGGNLTIDGIIIGKVATNSGGTLKLSFNGNATQARFDEALRFIAYANTGKPGPGDLVTLNWLFSDGNTGLQGAGSALTVSANSDVEITAPHASSGAVLAVTNGSMDMSKGIPLAITKLGQQVSGSFGWSEIKVSISGGTASYYGDFDYSGNALASSSTFSEYVHKTTKLGFSLDLNGSIGANKYFDLASKSSAFLDYALRGADKIVGGTGNDILRGMKGNDWLAGGKGNDHLDGGNDSDTMQGSLGNDSYVVGQAGDIVIELPGQGRDVVMASISYSLVDTDKAGIDGGNVEDLTLTGTANLSGTGNRLANVLIGNNGKNTLSGADGNDTLIGRHSADTLRGGLGNDKFVLKAASDSGLSATSRDIIVDFMRGQDKIDLSAIDANASASSNNAFTKMIASTATFTAAGQLKFAGGVLYGNTDADTAAEFSVQLTGISKLALGDFIL